MSYVLHEIEQLRGPGIYDYDTRRGRVIRHASNSPCC